MVKLLITITAGGFNRLRFFTFFNDVRRGESSLLFSLLSFSGTEYGRSFDIKFILLVLPKTIEVVVRLEKRYLV